MIRYGAVAKKMRPMNSQELLISRLILLLIMAKSKLKGYPMGECRKIAIVNNARQIFKQCLKQTTTESRAQEAASDSPAVSDDAHRADQLFYLRAQLLAVMMGAFARDKARGRFREKAMADNLERISKYLSDRFHVGNGKILKVA